MNILGIIPARAGSKRIPNKNIKNFAGKPLVQYIIEASCGSSLLTDIVVSSDSREVLAIAGKFNKVITLYRPENLASDDSPAIDYVKHTLEYLSPKKYDIIVILQPTSPLTLSEDIDKTIRKLIDTGSDSAVSIVELSHMINPLKLKVLSGDKLLSYLEEEKGRMAAKELPKVYVRNCAVYVSTINTIEKGQIIGEDCRGYLMPQERSVDINDPLDFAFAEFLFSRIK
jgi:CMP-N-acetylneuraminic acid synthetase